MDHGSSVHTPSTSSSPPASNTHSMDPDIEPLSCAAALNILFVGETNVGGNSIIELVAGPVGQKRTPHQAEHHGRSITLEGKTFILHATPTNDSLPTATIKIQDTPTDSRKIGRVHLLVYCMDASHSVKWTQEIHRTISSTLSPHIPAVAIVMGLSEKAQQERWWSSNEPTFVKQGLQLQQHAFIPIMTTRAQPFTGHHISQSRRTLYELILQNHAHAFDYETTFETQPGKPPSHTSTTSKDITVVLLGETGVGKSSLVNLIARDEVAEVSSDTVGCTKTNKKYSFEDGGRTFHLYDTPGLVDPLMDFERFITPIDAIHKLVRDIGNGNGPDLLLFCIDKPTAALKRNYRLFRKVICGGDISFAFAITKLEGSRDADEWWSRYGDTIRQYGIDRSNCIALGGEKGYSRSNAERSRDSLLSFLAARADRPRNGVATLRTLLGSVTAFLRSKFSTPERILMHECELEERTARELLNRIVPSPRVSCDVETKA